MKKNIAIQLTAALFMSAGTIQAQNTFPSSGNVGIGTLSPATSLQVIGSSRLGSATNYASVDASGNLAFNGTAAYKVGGNKYAFQFSGNPNYGLFFNQASVRYEFRNSAAAATFFAGADNGNGYFLGSLGLGVQSPSAKLHVKANDNSWPLSIMECNSQAGTWLSLGNTSAGGRWYSLIATGSGNGEGPGKLLFTSNSSFGQTKAIAMALDSNGNVMMGTTTPATGYKLTVAGKIICTELKVQLQPFPDYVFEKDYKLRTLKEVEDHIKNHKRLPGMPAAKEIESGGMDVGAMQGKVVEKVEELTLYILQQQKQIETLQQLVQTLQQQVAGK